VITAAAVAVVFNLLCSGSQVEWSRDAPLAERLSRSVEPGRPYQIEFRVDLDRRRWCFHDACDISFAIASISDTKLTLLSNDDRASGFRFGRHIEANRETGEFLMRRTSVKTIELTEGTCQRRPSPGLPKPKF
jgi:hypothetical protein